MKYTKKVEVTTDNRKASDLAKLADAFFAHIQWDTGGEGWSLGLHDKRPFGNSGPKPDILEIIGWDGEVDEDAERYASDLYGELVTYLPAEWKRMKDALAGLAAVRSLDKPTPAGGAG